MGNETSDVLLSIIIINYRTPNLVIECLETLLPELKNINSKIVVVDNNSNDKSLGYIKNWLVECDTESKVIFVESKSNNGFAAGNNIGIKALTADYYLLLNSDTLVKKGSIQAMIDTVRAYPHAGLISPRLEWKDGKGQESCFRFHSPFSEFLRAAQTGVLDNCFKTNIVALPIQTEIISPEWTSFACVLIKKEVIKQIGLLDDGYFMYYEDAEFCYRARKAGWLIIHNPNVSIIHLRGGSSPVKSNTKLKKRLPRYYYESRTRYFYQLYGWAGLTMANVLWWTGRILSKIRQIFGRRDKALSEKQWRDIWIHWLQPLKKYSHPTTINRK